MAHTFKPSLSHLQVTFKQSLSYTFKPHLSYTFKPPLRFCHRSHGRYGFEKIFQAVLFPTQLFQ